MKNWKALADAREVPIPVDEIKRVITPLEALEEVFRPLTWDLTPDVEPAFTLRAAEDAE